MASKKHPRQFNLWDNELLSSTLETALTIRQELEEFYPKGIPEVRPDRPRAISVLPSEMLYTLVVAYDAMYTRLLNEGLIKAGHNSTINPVTYH